MRAKRTGRVSNPRTTYDKMMARRLPRHEDGRVKLTQAQREGIPAMRASGLSNMAIAAKLGCSKRLVQLYADPAKLERQRKLYAERRKDGRYYDREKHRKAIAATRAKHRRLYA